MRPSSPLIGAFLGLAALLTALPVAAHEPNPRLRELAANTALDLGPFRCPMLEGDEAGCASLADYSRFVYDPITHQLLLFGGGHAATHRTDVLAFDFATLKWSSAYPSTPCADMRVRNLDRTRGAWTTTGQPLARHTYDMLVMATNVKQMLLLGNPNGQGPCTEDTNSDDSYFFNSRIAMYDPVAKTWSYSKASTDGWQDYGTAEYDPVTGFVIVMDQHSLWTYNPVTQTKTFQGRAWQPGLGYGKNLVYFPPTRRMYYIVDGGFIVEIDLGDGPTPRLRTRELSGISGDVPRLPETGFAYDPVNQVIGGGIIDGHFHAFDPATRRWTRQVMKTAPGAPLVGTVAFHALDYDPVNQVFVFITELESGRRTWAFRYAAPVPPAPAK